MLNNENIELQKDLQRVKEKEKKHFSQEYERQIFRYVINAIYLYNGIYLYIIIYMDKY